jgi:hypothetical protein
MGLHISSVLLALFNLLFFVAHVFVASVVGYLLLSAAIGDHFCPVLPPFLATENRARRMQSNATRMAVRQGVSYWCSLLL